MSKEEIKEYLKRVDELELKLTGEDKDTFQWLIFGYNECARLLHETEQENRELSRMCELYSKSLYNAELTSANERIDKTIKIIETYTTLNPQRIRQELLEILQGKE